MSRYRELIRKARLALALDDDDGTRGDVAPPAAHMPRADGHSGVPGGLSPEPPEGKTAWEIEEMESRCATCGQALSTNDKDRLGLCEECDKNKPVKKAFDKDEHGYGSYPRGESSGIVEAKRNPGKETPVTSHRIDDIMAKKGARPATVTYHPGKNASPDAKHNKPTKPVESHKPNAPTDYRPTWQQDEYPYGKGTASGKRDPWD